MATTAMNLARSVHPINRATTIKASGSSLPDSACNAQLTGDTAIVLANIDLSGELQGRFPDPV